MEGEAGGGADGVLVENLFDGGEALAFVRDFFGRSEDGDEFGAEGGGGEALELFTEDDGIGAFRFDEFDFLRAEGG